MIIETHVTPATYPGLETAGVELVRRDTADRTKVLVQWEEIRDRCRLPTGISLDLVLLASLAYCTDRFIRRSLANTEDNWTRDLALMVPVSDLTAWSPAGNTLDEALSFLTGDTWHLDFIPLPGPLFRARAKSVRRRRSRAKITGDAACLLSGGLDSLIGAINWLEENPGKRLLAVGHHDRHIHGPFGNQRDLIRLLSREYPARVDALLVQVGQDPAGTEPSLRSRSLLFLAVGIHAAQALGPEVPLFVPENGTIAINVPLTPSRRGSCSTRTTHPLFLDLLRSALGALDVSTPILNPLEDRTKGECVAECRNPKLLNEAVPLTVSCAKAGHRSTWVRKNAKSCGRCVPCIFRRSSLHTVGFDTEVYGVDICKGEVGLTYRGESANDVRAVVDFLRAEYTVDDIANILLASGGLPLEKLDHCARLVHRAMDEVRQLLESEGDAEVRAWLE
jgi:hypothetical protein